ncbi:MAG: serine hydrolase [Saprospiraceae bacterium]|nr:serine hydrolase [Saprospiraceae bacterium]
MNKHTVLLFVFSTLSLVQTRAQNLYFPPLTGNTWQTLTPASQNFCAERIDSLYQFLETNSTKGFLLLKDGKIVLEKYFDTFVQDSFWYWASAGKSLTAFLVGQAQDAGLVNIQDKTSDYLGVGWTSAPADKEAKITLWHQLTMTNGLDDTFVPTPTDPDPNLCKEPECLNYLADAGTRWAYHTGAYRLLHDVLAEASNATIQQYTKSALLDQVGMKGFWFQDVFYSRPRDMARFGLLCLAQGVWNGDTLLHDQAYFNAMVNTSQTHNKSYGYLWWLNGKQSFMVPGLQFSFPGKLIPNAPNDMYAALGKNDQKLHIVPSKGWVVVRLGNVGGFTGPGGDAVPIQFDNAMWNYLNQLDCNAVATTEPAALNIQISPNPTSDSWLLISDHRIDYLEITDVNGRLLRSLSNEQETAVQIDGRDFKPGVYYARLYGAGNSTTVKLVKSANE